ncbi:uncharacterized protein LOC131844433 [Achroia grisella]|uniref:uncharacterized protein LOC131844433 n=1 Tax=Achroia grisella TaxID=688607 RepID=UPI0027D2BD27|nr:uncharacterized protein LOC131844433 [Achroia grisella]
MELINIFVIVLVVCVLECSNMSQDEIEDFTNYLQKTSRLDQTLKKGADPDDDYDEDEPATDHAWEESGKFEGDLILNERQRRLIVEDIAEGLSRNGLRDSTKRWPNNEVIYYVQKEHFSSDQMDAIQNGIDDIAQASCIKFRPYKKGDRDAVVIQGSRRGCFSQVGYQGGYQVLNLSGRHPVGRGCFRHGTVVHEMLHTLGFYHMQSSPDRDDYVDVVWENIIQPARHNFRKYNTFAVSDFGVGYDYDSVLHYSRRAFSANGQDTIVPKSSGADIGQRVGLSDKDTQKLNKMYCDAGSSNFDAEEVITKKPTKKKTPKNKPFDGHGIGYHQGKTVVIKLLPSAETYQLPDIPEFHLFDYFSKAPQAVSTSKIGDPGKQLEYNVNNPTASFNQEYYNNKGETKLQYTTENSLEGVYDNNDEQRRTGKSAEKNTEDNSSLSPFFTDKNQTNSQESSSEVDNENISVEMSPEVENNQNISSDKLDDDLNDAFERLGKIIKTHVYPSQIPDLNIYKINTDYKEFYSPEQISGKMAHKIKYLDESDYISVPLKKIIEEKGYTNREHEGSTNLALKNVETLPIVHNYKEQDDDKDSDNKQDNRHEYSKAPEVLDSSELTSKEMDSSYRTSFPIKYEHYTPKIQKTSDYASLSNILQKNNYSSFYSPHDEVADNDTMIPYKILGKLVPVYDEWYIKDEYKHNPANYNLNHYGSDLQEKKFNQVSADKAQKIYAPNAKNLYSPRAYLLFGIPIPLTQSWYDTPDAGIPLHNSDYISKTIDLKKTDEDNR